MPDNTENTERLILQAIDMWDREMRQLFMPEQGHKCPCCPKRFIYGCLCSYERLLVERTIDQMLSKGLVSKHCCEGETGDFCLQKNDA